jgi:hypothetical protein
LRVWNISGTAFISIETALLIGAVWIDNCLANLIWFAYDHGVVVAVFIGRSVTALMAHLRLSGTRHCAV